MKVLRHSVEKAEGERMPKELPVRVAHTVGICDLHTVLLSVATALRVRETVVLELSENDDETLPKVESLMLQVNEAVAEVVP